MLARLDLRGVTGDPTPHLPRPAAATALPTAEVRSILDQVRAGGDAALRSLTERFDGAVVDGPVVPREACKEALEAIPGDLRAALEAAHGAIEGFHRHSVVEVGPYEGDGVVVRTLRRPVARAGCYVPGGRAAYPSTVLMTAVPARVAGVGEVVLCVPPGRDGTVAAPTLAAAAIAGVDQVYRVGGAQAIGAMAYGTESVAPVDVIVGPGNLYVSVAQREVAGQVGVPAAFAGPSEVVVVADATIPAAWAGIDVVVQAEHGPHGLAWLVTWSEEVADAVGAEVARLVEASPRRDEIEATLAEGGYTVLVDGPEAALAVANAIAPEHLELLVEGAEDLLPLVHNAGAVFTGAFAPAAVGDYLAGPSHVLPTNGSARFASALGVDDFVRQVHAIGLDRPTLGRLGPHVAAIAEA
ncbi:MAG TPA: histidinol dehydrogenase, partial [Acidimicrobiales bacterium]|nr:histidinol dehydrogenase [Acidimicrobiales bacterium]